VKRLGARTLSHFHRLGIALVILGMMQSLAPTCFRPTRSTLRQFGRLSVALARLGESEAPVELLLTGPILPSSTEQNPESDQESHDTEDLAETFAWTEAVTDRLSVQGTGAPSASGSIAKLVRASDQTQSSLQRSRALSILAASSSSMTTRLCRLTC